MISLSKDEARLYNYMMEVIDQVMDNYGYDYVMGKNISKKYYTNNLENINVFNECDSILEKEETVDGLKQYWRLHRQFDSFIESLKEANESI